MDIRIYLPSKTKNIGIGFQHGTLAPAGLSLILFTLTDWSSGEEADEVGEQALFQGGLLVSLKCCILFSLSAAKRKGMISSIVDVA